MKEVKQLILSLLTIAVIFGLTNCVAIALLIHFDYPIATLGLTYATLIIVCMYYPRY